MRARGVADGSTASLRYVLVRDIFISVLTISSTLPRYLRCNSLPYVGCVRYSDQKICLGETVSTTSSEVDRQTAGILMNVTASVGAQEAVT